MKKLGAIWRGTTKDKKTYFSGQIELIAGLKQQIVLFAFERQDGTKTDKDPAYNIFLSDPLDAKDKHIPEKAVD